MQTLIPNSFDQLLRDGVLTITLSYAKSATVKRNMAKRNESDLEAFIAENCVQKKGSTLLFKEFYEQFHDWLSEEEKGNWSKKKTSGSLPAQFPKRHRHKNKLHIENIAWRANVAT